MSNGWRYLHFIVVVGLLGLVPVGLASSNMILNGSFETNSAGGTMYNLSNAQLTAIVANVTGFGSAGEIDLMTFGAYGLPPEDGSWKLGLHTQSSLAFNDAFSFNLSGPIVAGKPYALDFYAQADLDFDPGRGPIEVGVSTSPTDFGTLVYTTTNQLSTNSWDHLVTTFVAPINASYLTVRTSLAAQTWAHVDNFTLTPEPGTAALFALAALLVRRRN